MKTTKADVSKLLLEYPHLRHLKDKAPQSIEFLASELKRGDSVRKHLNEGREKFLKR